MVRPSASDTVGVQPNTSRALLVCSAERASSPERAGAKSRAAVVPDTDCSVVASVFTEVSILVPMLNARASSRPGLGNVVDVAAAKFAAATSDRKSVV